MDAMLVIILCFATAAMFGTYLLIKVLKNIKPSFTLGMIHTFFAVTSLSLLTAHVLRTQSDDIAAFITFIFVGCLGLFMMYREFFSEGGQTGLETYVPKPIALIHGFAAVAGFILLLLAYFG